MNKKPVKENEIQTLMAPAIQEVKTWFLRNFKPEDKVTIAFESCNKGSKKETFNYCADFTNYLYNIAEEKFKTSNMTDIPDKEMSRRIKKWVEEVTDIVARFEESKEHFISITYFTVYYEYSYDIKVSMQGMFKTENA